MSLVVEHFAELAVTRISRWIFNCYVLHGGNTCVVVDAGLPCTPDDLAGVLARTGETVAAVSATHGHSDHVAGAPRLMADHQAPLYLSAVTIGYLDGLRQPRTPPPAKVARIWPTLLSQPFDRAGLTGLVQGASVAGFGGSKGMVGELLGPARPLEDGQPLPGAPDWEVLYVPGHTDDSLALWHADSATLLSGDAVLTARGRAWFTPETVDDAAARRSERRLRVLRVEHLLPGHGRPVHGVDVWEQAR